ncbi:MAG TPA: hypothetical protein VM660_04070 [Bacillus sp. (in: firmicutes)]|nr:hypothetical protein [Bacillus sp. (in: firmicutes)]
MDYLRISIHDYGAPSLEELYYMVNYISQQIDITKPATMHCSGGKGRSGTSLDVIYRERE